MGKVENLDRLMKKIIYGLYSDEVTSFFRESSGNPQIRYSPTDIFADIQDLNSLPDALDYLVRLGFLDIDKSQNGRTVYSLSGGKMEQAREFWFSELGEIMAEKLEAVIAKLLAKKIAAEHDETEAQETSDLSFQE